MRDDITPGEALAYDAILIPGGGVRAEGVLPPWAKRRFDRALEVYAGEFLMPLSAGTAHRPPPLDAGGFPIFEAVAGAAYLAARGIDPRRILIESVSQDTIGNAFFAKLLHVDPRGLRKLLVITSDFHMERTAEIFRWVFGLAHAQPEFDLTFEAVPDEGLDDTALGARKAREQESLQVFREVQERIRTVAELREWMFAEHTAYSTAGRIRERETLPEEVLASY